MLGLLRSSGFTLVDLLVHALLWDGGRISPSSRHHGWRKCLVYDPPSESPDQ